MAKTTNCAFCGKELKKGFFMGEDTLLVGKELTLTCCRDCCAEQEELFRVFEPRFSVKLANLKYATKQKFSQAEIAQMYLRYKEEGLAKEKQNLEHPMETLKGFYAYNQDGYFTMREFGFGFLREDVGAKDMVKSCKQARWTESCGFTKNDITKIEYVRCGGGSKLGAFSEAFSYAIRLNDETNLTYRPCIGRMTVVGHGLLFGHRRSAERQIVALLEEFKRHIGSTLNIIRGKKR